MCEQCLTNAEVVLKDPLPGYTLMRARKGSESWPEGWYGLVQSNDPDFVFPGELLLDPLADVPDEDFEMMLAAVEPQYDAYLAAVEGLKKPLQSLPAILGYELVVACQRKGYSIEAHGTELAFWLMNHLARAKHRDELSKLGIMIVPDVSGSMTAEMMRDALTDRGFNVTIMPDIHFGMMQRGGTDLVPPSIEAISALIARDFKMDIFPLKEVPKANKPWYQRHGQRNGKPPRY